MPTGEAWAGLEHDRALLTSTAERVAGILRDRIMEGQFPPGTSMSEKEITERLGISRNTLREAFRLLGHENLIEHRLNRGVFVRELDLDDLRDLYRVRRVIECSAIRGITELPTAISDRLRGAVLEAEQAAFHGRWPDVGTANLRFHEAIVSLIGSPRINEQMRRIWAELRLVWHVMPDPRSIYEPYVSLNSQILDFLVMGDFSSAEKVLEEYLTDAEDRLVAAYAAASTR